MKIENLWWKGNSELTALTPSRYFLNSKLKLKWSPMLHQEQLSQTTNQSTKNSVVFQILETKLKKVTSANFIVLVKTDCGSSHRIHSSPWHKNWKLSVRSNTVDSKTLINFVKIDLSEAQATGSVRNWATSNIGSVLKNISVKIQFLVRCFTLGVVMFSFFNLENTTGHYLVINFWKYLKEKFAPAFTVSWNSSSTTGKTLSRDSG